MQNKFVRSCQKNSKEVQEALFALGYKWDSCGRRVKYLNKRYIHSYKDGSLCFSEQTDTIPCLYDFTEETKLVATLKPINNELAELREQADALLAKIKEIEAKQCKA